MPGYNRDIMQKRGQQIVSQEPWFVPGGRFLPQINQVFEILLRLVLRRPWPLSKIIPIQTD